MQENKVNFIIQLNDQLVIGEVANFVMYIETNKDKSKFDLSYYPGDLAISEQAIVSLKHDSIKSSILMFDLYSYKGNKQRILNVKTNFSKILLDQAYVILNVYDLREKINKRQLGHLTEDNYICELVFPNSGRLIRRR